MGLEEKQEDSRQGQIFPLGLKEGINTCQEKMEQKDHQIKYRMPS